MSERATDRSDAAYYAALASPARRQVLDTLTRSAVPLDAHAIAAELDLHVTTVRFHLEHLREALLVRRAVDPQKRRGRPRMLFTPVGDPGRDRSVQEQLIDTLATAFAHRDDDGGRARAVEAGRSWARALGGGASGEGASGEGASGEGASGAGASGGGEAALLDALEGLGFDPSRDGGIVELRACPFRDAARRHPDVICAAHQGLVDQFLAAGSPPGDESSRGRLLPFVRPDLCVIDLG